jgi:hypothetical protein
MHHCRNVWSAVELQAKYSMAIWSAPMYSAFSGIKRLLAMMDSARSLPYKLTVSMDLYRHPGERVDIRGFGSFTIKDRKARLVRRDHGHSDSLCWLISFRTPSVVIA